MREVGSFLAAGDIRPGDRGAVFAPNRVEWASAALAIQAAGGVMVPIYPASTAEQAAYVASHSDARVVFVDTPALLARIFEYWAGYEEVRRRSSRSTTDSTSRACPRTSARRGAARQ